MKPAVRPRIRIKPSPAGNARPLLPPHQPKSSLNEKILRSPPPKTHKKRKKSRIFALPEQKTVLQALRIGAICVATGFVLPLIWVYGGAIYLFSVLMAAGAGAALYFSVGRMKKFLRDRTYRRKSSGSLDIVREAAGKQVETSFDGQAQGVSPSPAAVSRPQHPAFSAYMDAAQLSDEKEFSAPPLPGYFGPDDRETVPLFQSNNFADWSDAKVIRCVSEAIAQKRIDLFIQPIVRLPQRKRRFYEMYSRIRIRPDVYLPAERYIGIAKDRNMLAEIDNALLLRGLQLIRAADAGNLNRSFFCNISSLTLNDERFMRDLIAFLTQNRLLAPRLIFELNQEDIKTMDGGTLKILDGLSHLGCRFAMDGVTDFALDFDRIRQCRIRYVKIPVRTALRKIAHPEGFAALKRLKDGLNYYGIEMIVEKIEAEKQLIELLDADIEYGQGYLFGEPRKWSPE